MPQPKTPKAAHPPFVQIEVDLQDPIWPGAMFGITEAGRRWMETNQGWVDVTDWPTPSPALPGKVQ